MTEQVKTQPVYKLKFRDLPTTGVAIWKNTSKEGKTFFSFEVNYSYKDQKGNWQEMKISLFPSEMALFKDLVAKAHLDYQTSPQFKREPRQVEETVSGQETA